MRKVIRNYTLQLTQDFTPWKLALPFGADIVGFAQIGSTGQMFVLEDTDIPADAARIEREFLTVTVGRDFEAPENMKLLGGLLLTDPAPVFISGTAPVQVFIPLIVYEVLPAPKPQKLTVQ